MALSNAQIRAIAIRRSIAKRAQAPATSTPRIANARRPMSTALVQSCVDAGGFDQNAAYA